MNPLAGIGYGFSIAMGLENLVAALAGAFIGTAVGILPGLGPTVVIALLLIPTMSMKAETGLIMLGGIYFGTQYGDSLSAILMGVPSEAPSVVIGIDGYQMAKKGRAGAALAVAAVGSFIGASIGLLGLTFVAAVISRGALAFGPPEYFCTALVGLFILVRVSSTSVFAGMLPLAFGVLLTTVGTDPIAGTPRFTFNILDLTLGIDLVPMVMGIIGMAEMFAIAASPRGLPKPTAVIFRKLLPTWREWRDAIPAAFRGSLMGFFLGLLPGPVLTLATFASYRLEKWLAPTEVGSGSVRAVAGPKAADDAAISGCLVPLMALGIPFTSTAAVLYAGLLLHGVQPGPLLMTEHPEIFWGLVAAMYIGNLALLILNFPLVGLWVNVLRIPQPILSAALVILMLIGSYSLRNSTLDMVVVLFAGLVGYIMKQVNLDRTLVILGLVLGPILESNFRRSLEMRRGDILIFAQRPITRVLLLILLVVYILPAIWGPVWRRLRPSVAPSHEEKPGV
jgi:putative tricarboxylic transport membrane protein